MKSKASKVRLTVHLTPEMMAHLREVASAADRSMSSIAAECIRKNLEKVAW